MSRRGARLGRPLHRGRKIAGGPNAAYRPKWAVKAAAEMGYKYYEPMVHFGRELMSEAGRTRR